MTVKDGFGLKRQTWKSDPRVRLLPMVLRGLLVELAAWAMDCTKRGYLMQNGKALGWVELATLVNYPVEDLRVGMDALRAAQLVDVARDGTFFIPLLVQAAARSDKNRINALAGKQGNLFENNEKQEVAEQTPETSVVSIAKAKEGRTKNEKAKTAPYIFNNNNIYIYGQRVPKAGQGNPMWVEFSVIKLHRAEYEALLAKLPVTDDQLMAMLGKQNDWLEARPDYQQNWLGVTLKFLWLATGAAKAAQQAA